MIRRQRYPRQAPSAVLVLALHIAAFFPATVAAAALLAAPSPVLAQAPQKLILIADKDNLLTQKIVSSLRKDYPALRHFRSQDPALIPLLAQAPETYLWLALGPRAAAQLAGSRVQHRAAFLVPDEALPPSLTAVRLTPDLARQLSWLRHAFPGRHRLLVLRHQDHRDSAQNLSLAAQQAGFQLDIVRVNNADEAVPALSAAMQKQRSASLLWLLPDPQVLTTNSVVALVHSALAARVPSVGFSDYFLRIGAVAAVHLDYPACAKQAIDLARQDPPVDNTIDANPDATIHFGPQASHLLVDQRLAERLGITVRGGTEIELLR